MTREEAIAIARQQYEAETRGKERFNEVSVELERGRAFMLREWVIDAILAASQPIPEHLQLNMAKVRATIERLVEEKSMLLAELADQYPVAIAARAMLAGEASKFDLEQVVIKIGNSTEAAKLEYLPPRLRGTP